MKAFEDAISATSTKWAPWYIIPADHKWVSRALVARILSNTTESLDLSLSRSDQGTAGDHRRSQEAARSREQEI